MKPWVCMRPTEDLSKLVVEIDTAILASSYEYHDLLGRCRECKVLTHFRDRGFCKKCYDRN